MTKIPYDDENPEHQHPQTAVSQWQRDNERWALSRWMHAWLNGWKCQNCGYDETL